MSNNHGSIEHHAQMQELTIFEAFVLAWLWKNNMECISNKQNQLVICDANAYHKSKKKPPYVIDFENQVLK